MDRELDRIDVDEDRPADIHNQNTIR